MPSSPHPLHRPALRRLACLSLVPLVAAGCFGGSGSSDADDVDMSSEATVTERELASWSPPSSGVLTEQQVEKYLRTSLLQFDLVRKHSEGLHARVERMEAREKKGGVIGGLRNVADAGRLVMDAADIMGGSYVRSARTLGYNPAEMEWVRERMTEAAAHVAVRQMREGTRLAAQQIRDQADEMERLRASGEASYLSAADIQRMRDGADEMERNAMEAEDAAAARNAEVLRRARPAVTDPMWMQLGWHGGGLFAWAGLANPDDADAQRQLDEYRQLFEDALENRVSAGMEADPE